MKRLIPSKIRLRLKLVHRSLKDVQSSISFANKQYDIDDFQYFIKENQPIKQSSFFENKIHNIKLGASYINNIIINEGETLSFWRLIGNPTIKRGFKEGRNLISGKLCSDTGGGLCQLSGIMYYVSLKAGLDIIERFNHTIDIYKDEDRFAPLGSDATVVYGYKDLRVRNPYTFPIKFKFEINNNNINCKLFSYKEIKPYKINFIKEDKDHEVNLITLSDNIIITSSIYGKLK